LLPIIKNLNGISFFTAVFNDLYSMQPNFDTWTLVFFFFSSLSVLLSLFFIARFKTQGASIYVAILVLLFGISLFDWVLFWTRYHYTFPHLMNLWITFCFAYGPLAFFYLKKLNGLALTPFQKIMHLSSCLVVFGYNCFFLFLSTAEKQTIILRGFPHHSIHPNLIYLINFLALIHMSAYCMACWAETRKFASSPPVRKWSVLFTTMLSLFVFNFILYHFLSRSSFFNKEWDYGISFSMVIFIAALAYSAYAQPDIFNGYFFKESFLGKKDADQIPLPVSNPEAIAKIEEKKYKNSPLSKETSSELLQQLLVLMQHEKCYLNPDINLSLLAEKMNLSRHLTSQLINEQLGVSFFEYIKMLRIEEAKQILADNKQSHKIIDVAFMVGFNNKVSFYTAFKEKTGMTPSEFVKSNMAIS
jgi:AraC-like DNA-binding protein